MEEVSISTPPSASTGKSVVDMDRAQSVSRHDLLCCPHVGTHARDVEDRLYSAPPNGKTSQSLK